MFLLLTISATTKAQVATNSPNLPGPGPIQDSPSDEPLTTSVLYGYDASGNRIRRKTKIINFNTKGAEHDDFNPLIDEWGERKVKIYPNPTYGNLKVEITGGDYDDDYQYVIYNTEGSKVSTGEILTAGVHPIPMSTLSNGVYVLILFTPEEKLTYKIIKR